MDNITWAGVLDGAVGATFGGAITLTGLWLTIRHERRVTDARAHDEAVLRSRRSTGRLIGFVAMFAQDTRRGFDALQDAAEDAAVVMALLARRDRSATIALANLWDGITRNIGGASTGDPAGRSGALDDLAAYRQMLTGEALERWSGLLMPIDAARDLAGPIVPRVGSRPQVIWGNVRARLRALLGQ